MWAIASGILAVALVGTAILAWLATTDADFTRQQNRDLRAEVERLKARLQDQPWTWRETDDSEWWKRDGGDKPLGDAW